MVINGKNPFNMTKEEVFGLYRTDPETGLSGSEARNRLGEYGKNKLQEKGGRTAFSILIGQLKGVMVFILLVACMVSYVLGEFVDGSVILFILILNTFLGFWQELNAEKAMQALKKLTVPYVRVRRDDDEEQIPAENLVPGDIVLLETGNIVPADIRIVEESNLKVRESTLTGESEPIGKSTDKIGQTDVELSDRVNMVYMGTVIVYGRGIGVVTGTGMNTELGKIAGLLQSVEDEKTPLQKKLAGLGKSLALVALGLILIVAFITFFHIGGVEALQHGTIGLKEIFLTSISMAVAAIPEGLPAIVTIALAIGAKKMLKKRALIRHLPSVETLGSVTVICSDKTGTLTQNRMTVTRIEMPEQSLDMKDIKNTVMNADLTLLFITGVLCNDAVLSEDDGTAVGDPTEGALVVAAAAAGFSKDKLEDQLPRVEELPFDAERKRMTTVHRIGDLRDETVKDVFHSAQIADTGGFLGLTKGSVDGIINVCNGIAINGKIEQLTEEMRSRILKQNHDMASNGIRVLAFAFKPIKPEDGNLKGEYEKDLVYVGMTGMVDPVRPEVKDAVLTCKMAGIRPVMITGDHPVTALAIARELRIDAQGTVLTGRELSAMTLDELEARVLEVSVYARVSPEHKMKIVDALQDRGQIVSMTGDGVNDAPALKSADIGVAMGITGTDVSKESSDMILIDDNFATIVRAVREGRTIFDNIRKFIRYILTGNTGEIIVMLFGPLFGLPIPLLPIQILWINLVTDGLPAVALGYEAPERNVMQRPPYKPGQGIFAGGLGRGIIVSGVLLGILCLIVGFAFFNQGHPVEVWRTMIFTSLTFCQMAYALCVRSSSRSVFSINPFTNIPMVIGVILTLGLQLMLIYVPFFQGIFKTTALSLSQLGVCLLAALSVMLFSELEKLITWIKKKILP
ncbi:MAG: cation-translocating P-type ATPase [Spirochaetales bacterium]|nr:cation-translocating P-type ATPase [Spirochaetales bacterium]